ncbi:MULTISPECIES: Flp family type IVb pilin [Ferrimonas]|uniref:Flp family type IVb pilin n=1 Tax=Ferrimonas TaxID=44011 RepID=UPI0004041C92|nr:MULTISPECIES: Flp family type IVb pilin [Ferrimonas]USD38812.1 Flp family type IVb pilin [Ferrimonas sp. SCSIO 43195]
MIKSIANLQALMHSLKQDQRGVTAIEYGLIGVAMAAALATVLGTTDGQFLKELTDAFTGIATKLSNANT